MQREQGQSRAFARIADGVKAVERLEARVADTSRSIGDRLADALRLEGALMVVDMQRNAVADGLPRD